MATTRPRRDGSQDGLFRELIDGFPHGIALFDADALMTYCNPALLRLNPRLEDIIETGLSWDRLLVEMVARGVMDRTAQQRLSQMESNLDESDRSSPRLVVEMRDQGYHEMLLVAVTGGGFVLDQRDVTKREMAEEQDREADALLRQVMEACPANLVMSRMDDGQIIYRSPAAREVLGPGKKVNEHFVNQADLADFVTALLPQGRLDEVFATLRDTEGTTFPALVSSRLIEYRGEDVAVSSLVDITKEVEMRKMLAAQRERIFETEKMSALGELLAGVAHELNNPLSVVVGHALMLREETDDPEIMRRVEQIEAAAERCAKIVKSFLAMAREQKVEKQSLALGDLLDNALRTIGEGDMEFGLAVQRDIPADAPQLCGDAAQLEQVFTNLLVNSQQAVTKSGKAGTVTIAARPDRGRRLMVIDFRDDGPGIPAHIGKRVFEPLFTTKEVGQGTGIGLAFCHRVLTAHGGSIELIPSEAGAHFRIHLPLAEGELDDGEERAGHASSNGRGHVLVIDDELDVAELIAEILRRDGFTVDMVHSGEEGLEALARSDYDALLVDINMPGIGGRGFLDRIKADRPELVGRIAFVTGSTMSPDSRGFLDNCGCPYLEKPVAPADVRALAQQIVSGGE
ncbi:hybrid sensor histidine kinase/response regulator [Erythrobacter mangrovi]|uniref:histidine kinase n=1 Tax=Erythrobacter mangrovi TaxID=2739433 RepID=A0A7D4C6C7_9SPHN|nr:ATP-binding protein [Erythrobacter mangrovi]QKG72325.1 response regulator [Erythrobacter mangrovi]